MFATGPRAVGFTIVWPEGRYLQLHDDVPRAIPAARSSWLGQPPAAGCDRLPARGRTVCSEPGFGASVSGSRTTSGAGSPSRPRLWAARRWPRLRPLPHPLRFCVGTATSSQPSTMAARTGVQADLRRRRTSVSSLCAWRGRTRRGDIRACDGALKNLGHELGRNTIKRLLAEHGIAPAPERGRSMLWSTFIKAHWGAIAATDLFTVEVVNPFGLVRYHVLFVIDIATRCVCIGGITSDPNGEWMKQVARNLTDMWDVVPPWQAIPHPRPGPTIHRGGTWAVERFRREAPAPSRR